MSDGEGGNGEGRAETATSAATGACAVDATARFRVQHSYLFAIAYRMLGSRAEAEDVLQDAWLRFAGADPAAVTSDRAFLATVVSRLCLDRMASAAARRETYVGPWLPEPLRAEPDDAPAADERLGLVESVSMALLRVLESLSPFERAVLLLREVFDFPYDDLAAMLQTSPESCRQHLHRAHAHLRQHRRPRPPSREQQTRLATAFFLAIQAGDLQALTSLLAEDACAVADSGGLAPSARKEIHGRDDVARFLVGINRKGGGVAATYEPTWLNGCFGLVARVDGAIEAAAIVETDGDRIRAVYITRNPVKLARLDQPLEPPLDH